MPYNPDPSEEEKEELEKISEDPPTKIVKVSPKVVGRITKKSKRRLLLIFCFLYVII